VETKRNSRYRAPAVAALLPALIIAGFYVWKTEGFFDGDDMMRYLHARHIFEKPAQIFSLWNRPLFVLLYSLPAQFGHKGTQIFSAILALTACLTAMRWAGKTGAKWAFLIPLLLITQPYFLHLAASCLTEMLFALILVYSLLMFSGKKYITAAVAGALLPLVRPEGAAAMAIILVFVILRTGKKTLPLIIGATPIIIWQLGGWLTTGDFLWALRQSSYTGEFGEADILFYFRHGILAFGPACTVLALIYTALLPSAYRKKDNDDSLRPALIIVGVQMAIYVLLVWKPVAGNPAAFLRFFVTVSPLVAVMAARGLESMLCRESRPWVPLAVCAGLIAWIMLCSRPVGIFVDAFGLKYAIFVSAPIVLVALVAVTAKLPKSAERILAAIVVLGALAWTLKDTPPREQWPEQAAAKRAVAEWVRMKVNLSQPTYARLKHLTFLYYLDLSGLKRDDFKLLTTDSMDNAPVGSVFIIEGRGAEKEFYGTMAGRTDTRIIKDYSIPDYTLAFLEKIKPGGKPPK